MASNFKILIHKNSESLHLKLMGDFDGSSAHELLNTIEVHGTKINKIFIHTSGLRDIFPFGRTVFQNNFSSVNNRSSSVIFTGDHEDQLAPEERWIPSGA
jgi:anti-anti-sigma regulatory factor